MQARNTRVGYVLFGVYLLMYGGFVLINAFAPQTMEATLGGVNYAILSGFGLILAAIFMAFLYGWLCGSTTDEADGQEGQE